MHAPSYFNLFICFAVQMVLDIPPQKRDYPRSYPIQNNYAWLYPLKPALQIHQNSDSALSKYMFGPKRSGHMFCSTCGVSLFNFVQNDEVPLRPVNARTINGVNVDEMQDDKREIVIRRKDEGFSVTYEEPEVV